MGKQNIRMKKRKHHEKERCIYIHLERRESFFSASCIERPIREASLLKSKRFEEEVEEEEEDGVVDDDDDEEEEEEEEACP